MIENTRAQDSPVEPGIGKCHVGGDILGHRPARRELHLAVLIATHGAELTLVVVKRKRPDRPEEAQEGPWDVAAPHRVLQPADQLGRQAPHGEVTLRSEYVHVQQFRIQLQQR